jgi:(1->4)-alpha-D-glucan 1-alpha-D-glucosylmutase
MSNPPTQDKSEVLAKLAARCGIASEYEDIWEECHITSDNTRQALLAAMHFSSDVSAEISLNEMEEREWRRLLPPVKVLRASEIPKIELSLPEAFTGLQHRWILTSEKGTVTTGEFFPVKLSKLDGKCLDGENFLRVELCLPLIETPGYYCFKIERHAIETELQGEMTLIVAPESCYQPQAVSGENRVWGPTVQLYGLRSRRNWGIGDFSDLCSLIDFTADVGGGIVGVGPLHALFPDDPERISPYSPSNHCFLNILYIDVEAIPEFVECEAACNLVASDSFQARLRCLRASKKVNHKDISAAKRTVLSLLYQHFREHHIVNKTERARAFEFFRDEGGEALEFHARFEALQEHFRRENPAIWGWPVWPAQYHQPKSQAVEEFAAEHKISVEFFVWMQWLVDEQLANVGKQSLRRGQGVGLYKDLAVGVNSGGSEAWIWQDVLASGAYAGAPPDEINSLGQDWGLPPFVPHRLREVAYMPFIKVLRANMRHCGALRIDHVMALTRMFWVPAGLSTKLGTYVSYPLEDMLGIVALESQRNHCLVIGEDLGTVPENFRPRLAATGVFSYRPFMFELAESGVFKLPDDYPRLSLVAVSTHDLPTLSGFWKGSDLDARAALQLFPSEEWHNRLVVKRAQDCAQMLIALEQEGLLPKNVNIDPVSVPDITNSLVIAMHAYLARTKAKIMVVQPEDIFGVIDQANLPGSQDDQYPNWQRRIPLDLEDWRNDDRFAAVVEVLIRERGRAVTLKEEE